MVNPLSSYYKRLEISKCISFWQVYIFLGYLASEKNFYDYQPSWQLAVLLFWGKTPILIVVHLGDIFRKKVSGGVQITYTCLWGAQEYFRKVVSQIDELIEEVRRWQVTVT